MFRYKLISGIVCVLLFCSASFSMDAKDHESNLLLPPGVTSGDAIIAVGDLIERGIFPIVIIGERICPGISEIITLCNKEDVEECQRSIPIISLGGIDLFIQHGWQELPTSGRMIAITPSNLLNLSFMDRTTIVHTKMLKRWKADENLLDKRLSFEKDVDLSELSSLYRQSKEEVERCPKTARIYIASDKDYHEPQYSYEYLTSVNRLVFDYLLYQYFQQLENK